MFDLVSVAHTNRSRGDGQLPAVAALGDLPVFLWVPKAMFTSEARTSAAAEKRNH